MLKELENLDKICEILWEEKENWRTAIENYLIDLSGIYEKFIQLINIGKIIDYTVEEVLEQIQRLMDGLEHRDNMFIADVLIGETREILERMNIEDK